MKHIEIRRAVLCDTAEIVKIEETCFSVPWSESSVRESLQNENSYFYLALCNDVAIGYMGLQIFSGEGYVTNVAVMPEYRRQGIARALLETAMKNEMDFISLEVRESNAPAIALYASLGFETVGIRPKFYREPTENALIMTRKML